MLYNDKNQVVTLNNAQKQICNTAIADLANGITNTPEIRARLRIVGPLRETKEQPDPYGRSTGGMFSLATRANLAQ
jgi:hypothetical protein